MSAPRTCPNCRSIKAITNSDGSVVCGACGTELESNITYEQDYDPNTRGRQAIRISKRRTRTAQAAKWISFDEAFQRIILAQSKQLIDNFSCNPILTEVVGKVWLKFAEKMLEQTSSLAAMRTTNNEEEENDEENGTAGSNKGGGEVNESDEESYVDSDAERHDSEPATRVDRHSDEESDSDSNSKDGPNSVKEPNTVHDDLNRRTKRDESSHEESDERSDPERTAADPSSSGQSGDEDDEYAHKKKAKNQHSDSSSSSPNSSPVLKKSNNKKRSRDDIESDDDDDDEDEELEIKKKTPHAGEEDEDEEQEQEEGGIEQNEAVPQAVRFVSLAPILPRSRKSASRTLAFVYVGCLWLREPIMLTDIVRWACQGDLTFLSAWKTLPANTESRALFRPEYRPKSSYLQKQCWAIANLIGMTIPDLNWPPIVQRVVQELRLPDLLVKCTMSLFSRHPPALLLGGNPSDRAILMSYIVVAMKLVYGFDDSARNISFDKRNQFYRKLSHESLNAWLGERLALVLNEKIKIPSSARDLRKLDSLVGYVNFVKQHVILEHPPASAYRKQTDYVREMVQTFEYFYQQGTSKRTKTAESDDSVDMMLDSLSELDRSQESDSDDAEGTTGDTKSSPKKRGRDHPSKNYLLYGSSINGGTLHSSYLVLLEVCANYVDVELEELQAAVHLTEHGVIKGPTSKYQPKRSRRPPAAQQKGKPNSTMKTNKTSK